MGTVIGYNDDARAGPLSVQYCRFRTGNKVTFVVRILSGPATLYRRRSDPVTRVITNGLFFYHTGNNYNNNNSYNSHNKNSFTKINILVSE